MGICLAPHQLYVLVFILHLERAYVTVVNLLFRRPVMTQTNLRISIDAACSYKVIDADRVKIWLNFWWTGQYGFSKMVSAYMISAICNPFVVQTPQNEYFGKQWRPRWNVAFHQMLHCLVRQTRSTEKEIQYYFRNYNLWPLNIYNGLSWPYCM